MYSHHAKVNEFHTSTQFNTNATRTAQGAKQNTNVYIVANQEQAVSSTLMSFCFFAAGSMATRGAASSSSSSSLPGKGGNSASVAAVCFACFAVALDLPHLPLALAFAAAAHFCSAINLEVASMYQVAFCAREYCWLIQSNNHSLNQSIKQSINHDQPMSTPVE